jgi:hypothetical protein
MCLVCTRSRAESEQSSCGLFDARAGIAEKFPPRFPPERPNNRHIIVNRAIPLRAYGVGGQQRPWAELKEKIILLGRQDGLRWRR